MIKVDKSLLVRFFSCIKIEFVCIDLGDMFLVR